MSFVDGISRRNDLQGDALRAKLFEAMADLGAALSKHDYVETKLGDAPSADALTVHAVAYQQKAIAAARDFGLNLESIARNKESFPPDDLTKTRINIDGMVDALLDRIYVGGQFHTKGKNLPAAEEALRKSRDNRLPLCILESSLKMDNLRDVLHELVSEKRLDVLSDISQENSR